MNQSTLTDDSHAHPDDELLVAYLDGELDRSARTEVEDRLMSEDTLRERLSGLQAGWEMLDAIGTPDTDGSLVESTLELAIADLNKPRKLSSRGRSQSGLPLAAIGFGLGMVLLGLAIGGAVAKYQRDAAFQAELQDLAIAEDLEAYAHSNDRELMRLLSANADWIQLVSTVRELSDPGSESAPLYQVPIDQRTEAS